MVATEFCVIQDTGLFDHLAENENSYTYCHPFEGSFIRYYFPSIYLTKFFQPFQELKKADLESHLVRWAPKLRTKKGAIGRIGHLVQQERGPIFFLYKKMMALCSLLRPPECFIRIELLSLEPLKFHEPFDK